MTPRRQSMLHKEPAAPSAAGLKSGHVLGDEAPGRRGATRAHTRRQYDGSYSPNYFGPMMARMGTSQVSTPKSWVCGTLTYPTSAPPHRAEKALR